MPFKIVDAKGRQPGRSASKAAEVSYYGKTAQFRLTPAAVEALGDPDKIEVLYDEDTRQVAFRASDAAHAVALRKDGPDSRSRYFGFRSFANMVGLADDAREVMPLTAEEDMLVATLPTATA